MPAIYPCVLDIFFPFYVFKRVVGDKGHRITWETGAQFCVIGLQYLTWPLNLRERYRKCWQVYKWKYLVVKISGNLVGDIMQGFKNLYPKSRETTKKSN